LAPRFLGNMLMLQPLLLANAFGTGEYARIYSLSQLVTAFGAAGGPALVGITAQATGGYLLAYLVAAGASLAGLVILGLAGPPAKAAPCA
jgi:hypothetical protein